MTKVDSIVKKFLLDWNIDGAEVAISKDGKLIYNRGFGFADQDSGEVAMPYHRYRIASVSKPITSIAIMKMIENGQLGINDTVFGPGKIITDTFYLNAITDSRIYKITVKNLLEHNAGWNRDIACDGYTHCDPIAFPLHVTSSLGLANPVTDSALIKFLLKKGLNYTPGTTYAYSNIGYLVLAKVIERKSGMKYEDFVKTTIMQPLGNCDIVLGKNLLADKQEREAEYNSNFTTQSLYGTGAMVQWQYGGWSLEAMHAHGGWIATSEDLVKMMLGVDGYTSYPDVLSSASVSLMASPSAPASYYAKGWSVNGIGNWWHTGSLDGTAAFICRASPTSAYPGVTFALLFNNRSSNNNAFWTALDALPWNALALITSYPTHNLFAPSQNASSVSATRTGPTANITWTNGDGDKRLIVVTESGSEVGFPFAGSTYIANSAYGTGQSLAANSYVVYDGIATSVSVSGLDPGKTYSVTAFEYNNNATTGNNAVYKYGCRSTFNMLPVGINIRSIEDGNAITIVPNPANEHISIYTSDTEDQKIKVYDNTGKIIIRSEVKVNERIDVSKLQPGMYMIHVKNQSQTKVDKFIKQ